MDELPPSARAFLDAMRDADDPSPDQRARSDEALRAALARRGIDGLPMLANTTAAGQPVRGEFGSRGLLAVKLGAGALAVIAVSYLGVRSWRPAPHDAQRAQPTAAAELAAPAVESRHDVATAAPPSSDVAREAEQRAPANAVRRPDLRRTHRAVDDSLAGELRTVAAVDALVRQQRYADALQMLERTETESAAVLREERSALRILARCGIEPNARTLREREQFLRASPRSVLAERVRTACLKPTPEEP